MIFLCLKSDFKTAQIELYQDQSKLDSFIFKNSKDLSKDLLDKIEKLLINNNLDFKDLSGINCFKGPGSFTSLRILIVSALSLSYSLNINIVGSEGSNWVKKGNQRLTNKQSDSFITPIYNSGPFVTKPKK